MHRDDKKTEEEIDPAILPPPPLSPLEKARELLNQTKEIYDKNSATDYVLNNIKDQFTTYAKLSKKKLNEEQQEQLKRELSPIKITNYISHPNVWFSQLDELPLQKNKLIETMNLLRELYSQIAKAYFSKKAPPELKEIEDALVKITTLVNKWIPDAEMKKLHTQREQLNQWLAAPPPPLTKKPFYFTQKRFNDRENKIADRIKKVNDNSFNLSFHTLNAFVTYRAMPVVENLKNKATHYQEHLDYYLTILPTLLQGIADAKSEREVKIIEETLAKEKNKFENELKSLLKPFNEFKQVYTQFDNAISIRTKIVTTLGKGAEGKRQHIESKLDTKIKSILKISEIMSGLRATDPEVKNVEKIYLIQTKFRMINDSLTAKRPELKKAQLKWQEHSLKVIKEAKGLLQIPLTERDIAAEVLKLKMALDDKTEIKGVQNKFNHFSLLTQQLAAIKNDTFFSRMKNEIEKAISTIVEISPEYISEEERENVLRALRAREAEIEAKQASQQAQLAEQAFVLSDLEYRVADQLNRVVDPELKLMQVDVDEMKEEYKSLQQDFDGVKSKPAATNLVAVTAAQDQYQQMKTQLDLLNHSCQTKQAELSGLISVLKKNLQPIFGVYQFVLESISKQIDIILELSNSRIGEGLQEKLTELNKTKMALSQPVSVSAEKKVDMNAARALIERMEYSLASIELSLERLQTAEYPAYMKEKLLSDRSTIEAIIPKLKIPAPALQERASRVLSDINNKIEILNRRAVHVEVKAGSESTLKSIFFHRRRK